VAAETFEDDDEFLRKLGEEIRLGRISAAMTQAELGARIGVARCSVANIEAGRQGITVTRLARISTVLRLRTLCGGLPSRRATWSTASHRSPA
jgi:transcriptional regulator with XRE-family HTH domain